MRKCIKCGASQGLLSDRRWCHDCYNEKGRAAYKEHPTYRARLMKRYGISETTYEYMKLAQHGKCLICGSRPERLVVDHDHETNEVRALICRFCNFMLGNAKESAEVLTKGAAYLKNWERLQRVAA